MDRRRATAEIKIQIKITVLALAVLLVCLDQPLPAAAAAAPDSLYAGDVNADAVLKNLDFQDVRNSNTWARDAIYEACALGVMKGMRNMDRRFGITDRLSKEEAIAVAYRAAGREAEAQALGESMNAVRAAADKKTDPLDVWYDGYLQLAANDGLITVQDLAGALNTDQTGLTNASFRRTAPAQRQEMAFWLAKTLNLQPVRGQQDIFNNYTDWRSADPDKIPYIEAVLRDKIMNGTGDGRFNPTQAVTREQAAQIVKNAESQVLTALKYFKNTGTVEDIAATGDYSGGTSVSGKNIDIRNTGGKLDRIVVTIPGNSGGSGRNEQAGAASPPQKKETAVYRDGVTGNSSLLREGDRIEYIVSSADSSVRFINVVSNTNDVRYVAAQVNNVDEGALLINVMQLFSMEFPDVDTLNQDVSLGSDGPLNMTYRYGKNVQVTVNGARTSMAGVSPGSSVILSISNGNIVTAIQSVDLGINSEERYIVRGVVEDNNPKLGYITLYNEDGTGSGKTSGAGGQPAALRTYNYINQNKLEVYREHKPAEIDDVQTGDTAYIRLNEDGDVSSVSAAGNYTVKYGKVLSRLPAEMAVEYEDGTQQVLVVGSDVPVIRDKKLASYGEVTNGDRVKLILNITDKSTGLKEITIEGSEHFITNIYKGIISNIDDISGKISTLNLQVFSSGKWVRTDRKGFTVIPLAEGFRIYSDGRNTDVENAGRLPASSEAYIAVESGYGGVEKAVLLSYRDGDATEVLYTDDITGIIPGSGIFNLARELKQVGYDAGSIIVKYGRLVSGSSLADDDKACMAVNRDYATGSLNAGVVKVDGLQNTGASRIYRARITGINDNRDFTVESYSRLDGTDWTYYNTPRTFRLTFGTRMLGDDGLLNVRGFTGYGADSYVGRVVYVLADGTDALLISTAPYGTVNVKGAVYDVTGAETGEEGSLLTEPDGLAIRSVEIYDPTGMIWKGGGDMTLDILKNSIIIKNGSVVKPSDIKKGESVSIIKKDAGATGDAYIIMIE